jgi:hypothetical protein
MGSLRSYSDCSGIVVNGVLLAEPTFTDRNDPEAESLFLWDHHLFPTGIILDDGTIQIDEEEEV